MENKIYESYQLQDKEFEEYKRIALLTTTLGKHPSDDKTLIIVGGQSGAGKSRLIPIAAQEMEGNAVIVDFDELRALHPLYKKVSSLYPEDTHKILHHDTERVKNELLNSLIEQNYNVIYEGALRNTQGFVDFTEKFRKSNYKIVMDIMSVPKLESYGSTFYRYAAAIMEDITPRWVEKSAHDGSYDGVIKTVQTFINNGLTHNIRVFVREADSPKLIYTTKDRQYPDAISAIKYGREAGRKKAVCDFQSKYEIVEDVFKRNCPELIEKLSDWVDLYESEKEYINLNEKEGAYRD